MTRGSFRYGADLIEYDVLFVSEKRRNIAIHVHPDASVQVDAPEGEDLSRVHHAVLKRARWIKRHIDSANRQHAGVLPRTYVSGESVFYLGRRYQLKVAGVNGSGPGVKLLRGQVRVCVPSREPTAISKQLAEWYRGRARDVFTRRLADIADHVPWLDEPPDWRLVTMRKQWGSCSPSGLILLNPHLVKAPRPCVDYVICHELCHLREHNHSPKYYRLLEQLMPDWEPVKARLDGMAGLLLNE